MTSASAVDKVRILLDKYSTPYFTDDEVLGFLNMAQLERLRRLVPDDQGGLNFEMDQNVIQNIAGLLYTINTSVDNNGVIPYSTIGTLLQTLSSDSDAGVYRIMSVAVQVNSTYLPAKWARFNNLFTSINNTFKTPSASNLTYTIEQNSFGGRSIRFWQYAAVGFPAIVSVIKTPKIMTIANSPDWDDANMNLIIEIACQYGVVSMRDVDGQQQLNSTTISK